LGGLSTIHIAIIHDTYLQYIVALLVIIMHTVTVFTHGIESGHNSWSDCGCKLKNTLIYPDL